MCHFTIRLTIYRHQKVTLRIITFFLIIILAIELINAINIADKILATIICTMSCLIRSFSDVTEKYLFDYDYINIFKMLIYEGLMGIFLKSIYCHLNLWMSEYLAPVDNAINTNKCVSLL